MTFKTCVTYLNLFVYILSKIPFLLHSAGETMVKSIDFYISRTFVQDIYSSCRDVVNPSTNGRVMGEWRKFMYL